MKLEQARLSEDANMARRVQTLLAFKEQYVDNTVAAQVIGTSGSEQSRVLYIDKGSNDGIKTDMAVITPTGIVGKIVQVFPGSVAGAAHQRSIERRWSGAEGHASAGHSEGRAQRHHDAAVHHERRAGEAGRGGHHQRRRPHFSEGTAGRQGGVRSSPAKICS